MLAAVGGPDPTRPAAPVEQPAALPPANYAVGNSLDDRDLADMHRAARAAARASTTSAPAVVVAEQTRQVSAPPPAPARKTAKKTSPSTTKSTGKSTGRVSRSTRAAAAAAPADGSRASVVIAYALAQVGKPYVFGASGPNAYDCSGLLKAAFARVGIHLYHKSDAIAARGRPVARSQWQPGDVLAWPGHVALYLGNGQIVHASRRGVPVKVASVYGAPVGRRLL